MNNRLFIVFIYFFLSPFFLVAQGVEKFIPAQPNPPRLVNDYLKLLSDDQRNALEQKLSAFDDSTSNQIAVVTIGDIGDYEIEDFAVALGRKWGVGGKDNNNGVVLVVLIDKERNKKKIWIATGYGLEGAIPDITAKQIIEDEILPNFKAHDIYRGLEEGTNALMLASKGEYTPPEGYHKRKKKDGIPPFAIIIIVVIFLIISSIGRRGGGGGMISRSGRRHWGSSVPPIWFPSGGFSGGRSGGGGGFGGFGGGSFGGGGAGGSW
ncbi:MAG: TPM domain-containing protein [Bacteroidetes bacterium]|nr:TPM domain-containing protein [Bacteroidota bacterium]